MHSSEPHDSGGLPTGSINFAGSNATASLRVTKVSPQIKVSLKKSRVTVKQRAQVSVQVIIPGTLGAKAARARVAVYASHYGQADRNRQLLVAHQREEEFASHQKVVIL